MDKRLNPYLKHARKFGTEGVMETAAESRVPHPLLCELLTALDEIEAQQARSKKFGSVKTHRLTVEERVNRLLGIEATEEAK